MHGFDRSELFDSAVGDKGKASRSIVDLGRVWLA